MRSPGIITIASLQKITVKGFHEFSLSMGYYTQ